MFVCVSASWNCTMNTTRVWNWSRQKQTTRETGQRKKNTERKRLEENAGIVTSQANWKMRHPFYGLVCKCFHLFIRIQIARSLHLRLSPLVCSGSQCLKSFRTIPHPKLGAIMFAQLNCRVRLCLTHRYLRYIHHYNFCHTHSHSHFGDVHTVHWTFRFFFSSNPSN